MASKSKASKATVTIVNEIDRAMVARYGKAGAEWHRLAGDNRVSDIGAVTLLHAVMAMRGKNINEARACLNTYTMAILCDGAWKKSAISNPSCYSERAFFGSVYGIAPLHGKTPTLATLSKTLGNAYGIALCTEFKVEVAKVLEFASDKLNK